MSKVVSIRIEDEVAALFDSRAAAAGLTRADYLAGLLAGADESTAVAAAAKITELEGEVSRLKRELAKRAAVQVGPLGESIEELEAPRKVKARPGPRAVGPARSGLGAFCDHGPRALCRFASCRKG